MPPRFCVAQRPHARVQLAGDLVDSYDPALKEHRTCASWPSRARQGREAGAGAAGGARALPGRGKADPAAHLVEALRRLDVLFWRKDLAGQLMAAGNSTKVAMSSPAQFWPRAYNFVKWLRVGKEACPTLEQAKAS